MRILFILLACAVARADLNTITLTFTNGTTPGDAITVSGNTRTFTNDVSSNPTALILTNATAAVSATNYFTHIGLTRYPGVTARMTNATTVQLVGDGTLTMTISGAFGYVTRATNASGASTVVYYPVDTLPASARTNQASDLVYSLRYSTTAAPTNSPALANHMSLGPQPQMAANKILTNSTLVRGTIQGHTFFYGTNFFYLGSLIDNAEGDQWNFNQSGSRNTNTAARLSDISTLSNSVFLELASSNKSVSGKWTFEGNTSFSGSNFIAGPIYADSGIILGDALYASDISEWWTFNPTGLADENSPIRYKDLNGLGQSNTTFSGTNNWNGDLALQARANSSLANGGNAGVILGTNVVISLSGATTTATLAGFAAEREGAFHIVRLSGAVSHVIANESGLDSTAANRITTGTGGDITLTNQPAFIQLRYSGTRWELINWTR